MKSEQEAWEKFAISEGWATHANSGRDSAARKFFRAGWDCVERRIAENQKDMLAEQASEIQAKQLETVRAWMAGCKTIAALDERVIAEIGKLRGEGL